MDGMDRWICAVPHPHGLAFHLHNTCSHRSCRSPGDHEPVGAAVNHHVDSPSSSSSAYGVAALKHAISTLNTTSTAARTPGLPRAPSVYRVSSMAPFPTPIPQPGILLSPLHFTSSSFRHPRQGNFLLSDRWAERYLCVSLTCPSSLELPSQV